MLKVARIRQVFRWLQHEYPTRRPVRLVIYGEGDDDLNGWCDLDEGIVAINGIRPGDVCLETLVHEWTHWKYQYVGHGGRFYERFGIIWNHFAEGGGWKASREF